MCDIKESTFFRPWSLKENNSNQPLANKTRISTEKECAPVVKKEDDLDSISSVSTLEENNTLSESETSTSNSVVIRSRRHSESSYELSSRSCSVESEEVTGNSLDLLRNYTSTVDSCLANINVNAQSSKSGETSSAYNLKEHPAFSMDYLHRIAFHPQSIIPLNNSATTIPMDMEPTAIQTSTISTTGQPFYYEYPGVHLTQGLYPPSMEHAVEMLHRQDAAAKQMKKLRPKKFRCEHCDVAFSNNGQLKGHIRIHTGERPFKCDAEGCGKSFTRNEELTRHKRIHTGLRPHACLVCGKRFGRKDHLKKHTRTHENRDPYRMSAAALGMFAMGHGLPRGHSFPPYVYPI